MTLVEVTFTEHVTRTLTFDLDLAGYWPAGEKTIEELHELMDAQRAWNQPTEREWLSGTVSDRFVDEFIIPPPSLQCPECGQKEICAQNKAFVTQAVSLENNVVVRHEWASEDVEFDDGPEWYVCRHCGAHSEGISYFIALKWAATEVEGGGE